MREKAENRGVLSPKVTMNKGVQGLACLILGVALSASSSVLIEGDLMRSGMYEVMSTMDIPNMPKASPIPRAPISETSVRAEAGPHCERHVVPARSFRKRGFFRSGSKLGSILSQPGERK